MKPPPHLKQTSLMIKGMHCASCELLLERALKAVNGVVEATVDHRKGTAIIQCDASQLPSLEILEETIAKSGYSLDDGSHVPSAASSESGTMQIQIDGMTRGDCERLVRQTLKRIPGIRNVSVSPSRGTAQVHFTARPEWHQLKEAIESIGFQLRHSEDAPAVEEPVFRKWMEIGGALVIILALYQLLKTFDLVSLAPATSGALTLGGVLVIGIVAGTSSCLAVTGGLLLAMAAKYHERYPADSTWQKMKPLLSFNAGRVISYFLLGGVVGVIGSSLTLSPQITGVMNILVAFVMISLGLTILRVLPKGFIPLRPPKRLSHAIADLTESKHPLAPFSLGALTFFLPCGFTQSLQLAALASGSFVSGALIMGVFSLGTLPALIGISAISSSAKGSFSRIFLRFSGVLVVILALFNLQNGLVLAGFDIALPSFSPPAQTGDSNLPPVPADPTPVPSLPPAPGAVEEISMQVNSFSFVPNVLTVHAGSKVRWNIDGTNASGCTSYIVVPSLGISKGLSDGVNVVEFTAPSTPGTVAFSCGMGMVRGSFRVL